MGSTVAELVLLVVVPVLTLSGGPVADAGTASARCLTCTVDPGDTYRGCESFG
jgi:hypothetical protein